MYVQGVINELNKKKIPSMFIKLDISKAFDIVNWPYLLCIMSHLGFGYKWRSWISSLWCSASSLVLVNGIPSKRVLHCRGVRQGDRLSPMLFLLAEEPLHMLFKKAQDDLLLQKLGPQCDTFRVSLYADDVALFLNPDEKEMRVMECILKLFADASGLNTNMTKTKFYSIQCQETDLSFLSGAGQLVSTFPCTYLGMPLNTKKITGVALQPLIQKMVADYRGGKETL
jgi:hypothetical protein